MKIDKSHIDVVSISDGKVDLELTSTQSLNIMPNNVSMYDIVKGNRKFEWMLSLANLKTNFEIITGPAKLLFLLSNYKKIKIIQFKNDVLLINDIENLLFWTNGIAIETQKNIKFLSHDHLITKISGTGFIAVKYSGILEEFTVESKSDNRLYISPDSLFLYEESIKIKKMTVGKNVSSLWSDELLRIEGEGKIYITPHQYNNHTATTSKGDLAEEIPIIGKPIAIFNKVFK